MDEPSDLRVRASELRRQGFSYGQIGRRLGLHKSIVARWVTTIPFEGFNAESRDEQLRAMRDPGLYNRALELRQSGWSYAMIEAELGVARSTLSGWLRDVEVTEYDPAVRQRTLAAQRKAVEANKQRHSIARRELQTKAHEEIHDLLADGISERELFLIGLTLYWAEGSKTHTHVGIANSDPQVIKIFVRWATRCLNIELTQLRATVHTHPDVNIDEAEAYWSDVIDIPRSQFYKAQIDRRLDKSVEKCGKLSFGTVHVSVTGPGVVKLHHRIMGLIAGLGEIIITARD